MLRIVPSSSTDGAKRYFDEALKRGDYYLEGQEIAGNWGGKAASLLGLEGPVDQTGFHQLCDNLSPLTGDRLTARTKANRRVGYDFNFHCPKRVSAVYALTEDARILAAFQASVRETMQELEEDCETRVRDKGQNSSRVTGNMVWGDFTHFTSRPVDGLPDPHLHAHCFAFNATWDEQQGRWKAADFGAIKRDARYFEAAFHARFAGRMAQMGYPIDRDGKGFWDIAGIPETVKTKFSRRTALIEGLAEELGITDADRKAEIGARSRQGKAKNIGTKELQRAWDSWLTEDERAAIRKANEDADGSPRQPAVTAAEALGHAKAHLFSRRSAVPTRMLAEETLRRGVGAIGIDDAWTAIARTEAGLLHGTVGGRAMVTTSAVLNEERQMIAFARDGRGTCAPLGQEDFRLKDALFHDASSDTSEQEAAIRNILASRDLVTALRGAAGTGKTTLMREVVAGIEAAGRPVFAFAPTAAASRGVLRQEGFASADTVARLLSDPKLQAQLDGSVLWVDEAGLLGARDLHGVFRVAEVHDCRVILTGDTRQHAPVARGDALRILEEHGAIAPVAVTKIQRQRVREGREPDSIQRYRHAVRSLSEGDAVAGFTTLEGMGAIHEFDIDISLADRLGHIAGDYLDAASGRNRRGKPNEVLVVSPTHAEGDAVSRYIRETLREAGRIGKRDRDLVRLKKLQLTEAQRQDTVHYRPNQVIQFHQNVAGGFRRGAKYEVMEVGQQAVSISAPDGTTHELPLDKAARFTVYEQASLGLAKGDRIRITQNGFTADRKHRLNNGSLHTVDGFSRAGNLRLANGWEIDAGFGHLAHGYVTTSHAAQGKTVDQVLIAESAVSLPAASLEQFYVSVSRGREGVKIYTDDSEALGDSIRRSAERTSAHAVVGGEPRDSRQAGVGTREAARSPGQLARVMSDDGERQRRGRIRQVVEHRKETQRRRWRHDRTIDRPA